VPRLTRSLESFGTPAFEAVLKEELAALGPDALGLQLALSTGNTALPDGIGIMILSLQETSNAVQVRAGVFFTSIIGGCACADDPTPETANAEYCEIDITIDRRTGEALVSAAGD
jgi:hypothetical protein